MVLGLFAVIYVASSTISFAAADEDITISANTTWNAGTYTYRDITVTNNATLTLNGAYTTDTNGAGVIINARNVTVNSGSAISANGKGYAAGAGTGKGSGSFGSGAGYGGTGAAGETGTAGGVSYGSAVKPLDLGSGGGNAGGAGGGAINLNLSGNLSLAGVISANGNNGGMWKGSGSGGSVYINAVDMSGSGTITANGGTYTAAQGGGGRVALYYTGTYSLDPAKVLANSGGGTATNGSVFILDKTNKDLTISKSITLTPLMGIDINGDPSADGVFNLRNLTINNNSVLTVGSKYTTDTDGSGVSFILTGDLTVDAGSKVDAKGQGYAKNSGEGKGTASGNTYGGGAAHGGNGGRGEVGVGGTKYDVTLFPIKLGSGGVTTKGGAGGGIINVNAADIIVNGSLDASAGLATGDGATNGSGGAGGTIYLKCSSLTGSGTVLADGGNATGYSGGGGGGRIAIYGDTSAFNANNITTAKGLKGGSGASADGSVGTVFLYNTVSGNVTASSDVTFYANQGINRDGTVRTDGVFYFNSLTVTNNATVTIGGYYTNDSDGRGVTINLDGNLTVDSGATISASGQGFGAGYGAGKGSGGASTSGSGGSYGGVGGQSYNNNMAPAVYGATEANYPYRLGSSGGAGDQISGTSGGGAVTLRVLGNIVNNGVISADGSVAKASPIPGWFTGGGSGGSVFLVCDSLSGSGTVTAKGGNGGGTDYGSGGGGGGRISVVYSTNQNLPLGNFSASGGTGGGGVSNRNGAEGSVNITQRILPAADFVLKNPNNDSTEYTNTEDVKIVPADGAVQKYKDASSASELVPTFYAEGWNNVADGKDVGASEGNKTVRAWFKDGNELISSSVGTASITLDTTKPTVEINNNNQTVQDASTTIQLTLNDNLSGVDYITVKGQRVEIASLRQVSAAKVSSIRAYAAETILETTVSLDEGENSIPVVAYDKAGNSTEAIFVATRTIATVTPTSTPAQTSSTIPSSGNSTATSTPATVGSINATSASTDSQSETTSATVTDASPHITASDESSSNITDKISDIINPFSSLSNNDEAAPASPAKAAFDWIKLILFAAAIGVAITGLYVLRKKK